MTNLPLPKVHVLHKLQDAMATLPFSKVHILHAFQDAVANLPLSEVHMHTLYCVLSLTDCF